VGEESDIDIPYKFALFAEILKFVTMEDGCSPINSVIISDDRLCSIDHAPVSDKDNRENIFLNGNQEVVVNTRARD
jgi:hypothetical protein